MTTKTIAGRAVTLTEGRRYLASRPMAERGRNLYPIYITNEDGITIQELTPMTYEDANNFLREFNNGAISFEGRQW